jgi:hypothetical protein
MVAVTHRVPRSEWQGIVGNAGISRVSAQISCRTPRGIWEMWVEPSKPHRWLIGSVVPIFSIAFTIM